LVEVDEVPIQAHLVEVAAGHFDPSGVRDTARLQWVKAGSADQMLLIYTVSARGNKSHKDAALASINSLQRR